MHKFEHGTEVKNIVLKEDGRKIQMGIERNRKGECVKVMFLKTTDVKIATTPLGNILEDDHGDLMFTLETDYSVLEGVRLVYDGGWYITWDMSKEFTDKAMWFDGDHWHWVGGEDEIYQWPEFIPDPNAPVKVRGKYDR